MSSMEPVPDVSGTGFFHGENIPLTWPLQPARRRDRCDPSSRKPCCDIHTKMRDGV